jgi:hypothetical protein
VHRRWFFIFFIISGFCLVDGRLAEAGDGGVGVTTLVSIVLSVFMAGLALEAGWRSPRAPTEPRRTAPCARAYAAVELVIGLSGLLVPMEIGWGRPC